MIVSCPSCGTRYRHELAPGELSRQARCSQCDHRFPLRAARRTYVLLPARRSARRAPVPSAAMRIGMDDPALAPQLSATALQADSGQTAALSYAAVAAEAADSAPFEMPEPAPEAAAAAAPAARIPDDAPLEEAFATIAAQAPAEPAETQAGQAARAERPRGGLAHPLREFVLSMLLGGAGAAGGWYGSIEIGQDPYRWGPGGAAVGLFLAWAWVRWLAPKR